MPGTKKTAALTKKPIAIQISRPIATSSTTPVTTGDTGDTLVPTPTLSSAFVSPMAPPNILIPAPPIGFVPVDLGNFRACHPKAGQIAAAPGAVAELANSAGYATAFGAAVPPAPQVAEDLTHASSWTTMRVATEALLAYVKSFEVLTWNVALADIEALGASARLIQAQNPAALAAFPTLAKLLDVQKVIAKKGAATRARTTKAKASAPAATPATIAPVTSAPVATVITPSTGGATH